MQSSLAKVQRRFYYLAFNSKAKARPNFGLRGVGIWTSNVYCRSGSKLPTMILALVPPMIYLSYCFSGFCAHLEECYGGGAIELIPKIPEEKARPWVFYMDVGEGYAAGPPRVRPAPGAVPMEEMHGH